MPTFTTADGCELTYDDTGAHERKELPAILFLHGWSGSRRYFSRNVPLLQPHFRVICLDLRFHGESQSSAYGMHIARLAVDVHEFMTKGLHLSSPITLLGTSMGCAVIWSFIELFGTSLIRQAIFVDQVPLQNRRDDWTLHSYGCFDEASLQSLEKTLATNPSDVAQGNLSSCLVRPNDVPPAVLDQLAADVLRCNPTALATLMRDHTQIDWRSLLPTIAIPCLNLVGGPKNKVFPMDGALEVGRLLPNCTNVVFETCGHWLYLEQPVEFCDIVAAFVQSGHVPSTIPQHNGAVYVVDAKELRRRLVRVVCISDTHGKHDAMAIPRGDILIHAGDFSNIGTHNQVRRFAAWVAALPHPHKIVIAGNHEYSLDAAWYVNGGGRKRHKEFQDPVISRRMLTDVCTYVENEAVEVLGIRIYGSPNSPVIPGHTMAFNLLPGHESRAHWKAVPDNVDILVTHTPPHGILDTNLRGQACGDEELVNEVMTRMRPKYHVFGHIHEGYGTLEMNGTTFVNASSCNLRHQPENPPIVFDIAVASSCADRINRA